VLLSLRLSVKSVTVTPMLLLFITLIIALVVVLLGMLIMGRAGRHINIDRLQIFIALASGFMLAVLFLELLPENILHHPGGPRHFFKWALLGMGFVIVFERYGIRKLRFVERFFHSDHAALKTVEIHDEHVHESHGHGHHDHHDLEAAEHCAHSHDHGHVHQHTHLELMGFGEVCSAIACFMICSFFDGIALSSVQAVDQKLGILMMIGVVLHLLPEGVLSGVMALAGGATVRASQKVLIFIGGSFFIGALVPVFLRETMGGFTPDIEATLLAFSAGIVIFVDLVQLLPTALKLKFAPAWILAGVALFYVSHLLISHPHLG
jgi:zinc transporter ZupT